MIRWLAISLAMFSAGCVRSDISEADLAAVQAQAVEMAAALASEPTEQQAGVVVRLAFGPEADLDLYVTDPLLDTVYFARHESRTGGVIGADVRCDSSGPRVEEVRFDKIWPGRYRVGVDFPRRCDGARPPAPAAYAVEVNANGKTHRASGIVNLEFFEVIVLDFDVEEI
jgi:hypothetical protein